MQRSSVLASALVAIVAGGVAVRAMPVPPQPIPVSRLVSSLTARVKLNPADVQAVYTLGRVHYFAFAGATDTVNVISGSDAATPALYDLFTAGKAPSAQGRPSAPMTEADKVSHLKEAIANLSRAVTLKSGAVDGRYELALACAYEEGAPFAAQAGVLEGTAATDRAWIDAAIRHYGLAFDQAIAGDGKTKSRPIFGLSTLVSYEAGKSYQRLLARRGNATADERSRRDRIAASIVTMENLPRGPVTPIVFALNRRAELADLLAPDRVVSFDLDGSHRRQRYSWLQPDTGILVWDPDHLSRIASGRQLFGSVTWWMFWDDGYQALATLDADGNGWIEGRELRELAVWCDRDQNGISDPDEVLRIESTSIAAIAAFASRSADGAAMNQNGLRLRDGRVLPTYDWVAAPAPPAHTSF